jgi:hypothetical protein
MRITKAWLREMPLAKFEALVMRQGPFGKLFGYGTVVFKGSGGSRGRELQDDPSGIGIRR